MADAKVLNELRDDALLSHGHAVKAFSEGKWVRHYELALRAAESANSLGTISSDKNPFNQEKLPLLWKQFECGRNDELSNLGRNERDSIRDLLSAAKRPGLTPFLKLDVTKGGLRWQVLCLNLRPPPVCS